MWCAPTNPYPPDVRRLLSRRGFLRAGAIGAAAAGAGSLLDVRGAVELLGGHAALAEACDGLAGTIPISERSIQLYTLLPLMEVDAQLTLEQLYGIGYRRVEHAGFGSARTASAFKAACDAAGPEKIWSSSGHQSIAFPFDAEAFETTMTDALAVGQKYVISPSTNAASEADWRAYATALNAAGNRAKTVGIKVGHHNHTGEYTAIADAPSLMPIQILMSDCDPDVTTMEMDLCWVWSAGEDPVPWLEKYPNRYRQFHVKDMDSTGQPTYPGMGVIDFNRIFEAAARTQEIEEYIIEQDFSVNPLGTAQMGWDLLEAATFNCPAARAAAPAGPAPRPAPAAPAPAPAPTGTPRRRQLAATGPGTTLPLAAAATVALAALLRRRNALDE